jgi:acyl-CoA thioester hydrolase
MSRPFIHRLRVRYNECDRQGVVFNANYLTYVDITITELWREAFGSYEVMVERGIDIVVAEARIRYRRPARFDDELEIAMSVELIDENSITCRYELRRPDEMLAELQMRHVFVDGQTLRKTSTPDWVREGLAPFVVEAEVPSAQPVVERQ